MKKTHWRLFAAWAGVSFVLAAQAIVRVTPHSSSAGLEISLALFWSLLSIQGADRAFRGHRAERVYAWPEQRLRATRGRDGVPAQAFPVDIRGQRTDQLLTAIAFGIGAVGQAAGKRPGSDLLVWFLGAIAYVSLLAFLRSFRFSSHFVLTEAGIDCRFAVPSLEVSWEEIAGVRSTSTPGGTGWVLITLTDAALARLDERTRRRFERTAKRRNAHYRWADAYCASTAEEVFSIVERDRLDVLARSHIASGTGPVGLRTEPAADGPEVSSSGGRHARTTAGVIAAAGACVRVIAYFLPWVVGTGTRVVTLNGSKVGASVFSIWFSLAALGFAVAFLARRYEMSPWTLVGFGAGAIVASLANIAQLNDLVAQTHAALLAQGYAIAVSAGVGPWVQLVGAVGVLTGGILAVRAPSGPGPSEGAPGRPDRLWLGLSSPAPGPDSRW